MEQEIARQRAADRRDAGPAEMLRTGRISVGPAATALTALPLAALLTGHVALAADGPAGATTNADAPTIYSLGTLGPLAPITIPTYHATGSRAEFSIPISISNVGVAGQAEGLNVSWDSIRSVGTSDPILVPTLYVQGSVTNLAAGSTIANGLTLGYQQGLRGGVFSPDIYLRVASNGSTTSGNGLTSLPLAIIPVQATVIPFAEATIAGGRTIDVGSVRIGTTFTPVDVSVTNTAPVVAQADLLVANSVTAVAGSGFTASGGFGKVGGGTASGALASGQTNSKAIQIGMDTTTGGARNGQVLVNFLSDGGPSGNAVVPIQAGVVGDSGPFATSTLTVNGGVYRLADPVMTSPTTITAIGRTTDVLNGTYIAVTNKSPDIYTESLVTKVGSAPPGLVVTPQSTPITAGQSGNAALISVLHGIAGDFSGTVNLNYYSQGVAGEKGADTDIAVGSASVAVTAKVYQPAAPIHTGALNFGIVHVGDVSPTLNVAVTNAAAAPLTDTLRGAVVSLSNGYADRGTILPDKGIASGVTSTAMAIGLPTDQAGIFNGKAVIAFASHNEDMADQMLQSGTVLLSGQVNNHATLGLANPTVGSLEGSGNTYTLHLGAQSKGAIQVAIDILNQADGPADDLRPNGVTPLSPSTPGLFFTVRLDPLAAGETSAGGLSFILPNSYTGAFSWSYRIDAFETNESGYLGALQSGPITLTIDGSIGNVPEPWTIHLMITGLAAMAGVKARRARRRNLGG